MSGSVLDLLTLSLTVSSVVVNHVTQPRFPATSLFPPPSKLPRLPHAFSSRFGSRASNLPTMISPLVIATTSSFTRFALLPRTMAMVTGGSPAAGPGAGRSLRLKADDEHETPI
ncbi:hypothetical protein VTO42DRAFT_2396 [Malbranchea cinnamomea]